MESDERAEPHRPGPSEQDQPAERGRDIPPDDKGGGPGRTPEPGTDSRVTDWYGQSVARDAELAERLQAASDDEREAERRFEEEATGREEQAARHGDRIDPDGGQAAYREQPR
jgi:hypothetical protein